MSNRELGRRVTVEQVSERRRGQRFGFIMVLTHFSGRCCDGGTERFTDEAASAFGGHVVVAHDLTRVPFPARLRGFTATAGKPVSHTAR